MTLLSVRDLSVTFRVQQKQLEAVRGISFDVKKGEVLGLVGESGSGKSAAAKAIAQLNPSHSTVTSGNVLYNGQNLLTLPKKEMNRIRGNEIGVIFQDPMTSLNPTMKIGAQITEGYLRHNPGARPREAKEYAIRLLDLVGISEARTRVDQFPHVLSGGMRQRVMIAIALAPKPKLIIADEPTTALDVTIQAQILDLMVQIKEKTGTSFILITHDLSVVAGYCDHVLVMYAGKIVESAPVDILFNDPSHPYTQGLLASLPRLDMEQDSPLIPIEGMPPNLMYPKPGCPFAPRCPHATNQCHKESPALEENQPNHQTACWLEEHATSR